MYGTVFIFAQLYRDLGNSKIKYSMAEAKETASQPDLFLISVSSRIPEFWVDVPGMWFVQFEAAVSPQKASDDARYQLLIAKLGKAVIQQVTDILNAPPPERKYDALKQRLLSIYEESEKRRVQKLIGEMQLGDQKPSQLLRRMQNLAGNCISNEMLLILWQNHLPTSARAVLAATDLKDVDKLAAVADKVLESTAPVDIAAVAGTTSLAAEVAKLSMQIAEIQKLTHQSAHRSRSRSKSRSRDRRAFRKSKSTERASKNPEWLCFYHYRFKERATKCIEPCNWKGAKPSGN